jgi:hypothetical protein
MTMVVPGKPAMRAEGRSREMTSQKTGNGEKREGSDEVVVKLVDIAGQLGKLLETRRLEPQTIPFRGFGSPPGRF